MFGFGFAMAEKQINLQSGLTYVETSMLFLYRLDIVLLCPFVYLFCGFDIFPILQYYPLSP